MRAQHVPKGSLVNRSGINLPVRQMEKRYRCGKTNPGKLQFPPRFHKFSRSPVTCCGVLLKFVDGEGDTQADPGKGILSISRDRCVKPKPRLSRPPLLRLRLMDAGSGSCVMEAAGCGRAAAGRLKVAG